MTLLIIILIVVAVGVGVWYISRRRSPEATFGGQAKPKPLPMVQQKQPVAPKPFEAPKPPMPRPTPPLPRQSPPVADGGGPIPPMPPTPPAPPFPPSNPPAQTL